MLSLPTIANENMDIATVYLDIKTQMLHFCHAVVYLKCAITKSRGNRTTTTNAEVMLFKPTYEK